MDLEVSNNEKFLRKLLSLNRQYFPSNIQGSYIKDAITGEEYEDRIGTKNEEKYFRVIDCTGLVGPDGKKLLQGLFNPNSNRLFFKSKEEYLIFRNKTV